MKKSFRNILFGVAAFSMALAVGAGLGLADKKEVKPVEAADLVTLYCKCTQSWWTADNAGIGVHQWGGSTADTTWPGVRGTLLSATNGVWKFEIPSDRTGLIFTRINSSGAVADWGAKTANLTIPTDGKNLYTITSTSAVWGDPGVTGEWSVYDAPSSDGYYLVGSDIGWTYADARLMYFNDDYSPLDTDGNIAVYYGYEADAGDEIKVRSYINGTDTWYDSAATGGNYVFASAGSYDIFYKNNTFYVSEHHERHIVTVTHVLFDGKTQTGTEQGVDELATEGEVFNPTTLTKSGYAFRGYFTDANCTTAYTPAEPTADFDLYAKFTRSCYYLFGDDAFLGTGHGWNVDYASPVSAGTGDNRLEGVAVIPNTASAQNPVCIKPLLYDTNGQMVAETYTLGEERTFVSLDNDGNFAFTEGGTYAFYVNNQNKVYFNIGEYVFHTKFLTEVGGVCNEQGSTVIANLQSVWAEQKSAYNALSDADKKNITDVGFDGGDEDSSDDRLKMIAKYHYIVTKYGTSVVEDFIWNQTIAASQSNNSKLLFGNGASTEATVIIVTVTALAALAVGGYFLLKKKRA